MHDFRKRSREPRQAVDGFLGASQRPRMIDGTTPHRRVIGPDHFRSGSGRRLDDFKRTEGYHPATRSIERTVSKSGRSTTQATAPAPQASILHMTLPGGTLETTKREKTKKKRTPVKPSKWRTIRKWSLRSGMVAAALVLVVGGVLFAKGYFKLQKVFKGGGTAAALQEEVKPELLRGEGDGRVNILLLGRGGDNHEGPDLTDTLLVVSIDPVNKAANMVSIPRDLWVTTANTGSSKINAVYANNKYRAQNRDGLAKDKAHEAGITAIKQTVTEVLGIPLHYYAMVDFEAFKKAVDSVGGVDVQVAEDLVDYTVAWENGNSAVIARAGLQHFDGKKALLYVRSRHGTARGDFDRTERQRLFIQALTQKVLSAGTYTNPVKISQLMSAFGDHVATDFSINDSLRLANIVKEVGPTNIKSLGLADPPNNFVRTDAMNGQSVVRPTAGFGDYSQIHNFIRNSLKDPYLAQENAALVVLNGTDVSGLAGTKGDELKSYGYNVVRVDTAPTATYTKTVLVDVTGKKPFTKNYLEKRLGVKAVTKLPDTTIQAPEADFVIILGQDATAAN